MNANLNSNYGYKSSVRPDVENRPLLRKISC